MPVRFAVRFALAGWRRWCTFTGARVVLAGGVLADLAAVDELYQSPTTARRCSASAQKLEGWIPAEKLNAG